MEFKKGDQVRLKDKYFHNDGSKKTLQSDRPQAGWWGGEYDYKNPTKGQFGEVIEVTRTRIFVDFTDGEIDSHHYTDYYTMYKEDAVKNNGLLKISENYAI